MTSADFVLYALQIATMLAFALLFGQVMRRWNQPAVLGEMIGGIVIGPTIMGILFPGLYKWLFLSSADVTVVRDASTKLGMLFFLFIAGLETNISDLKTVGRRVAWIGIVGTLVPIAAGIALVYAVQRAFWGSRSNPTSLRLLCSSA
jgi:Kef-type K+ transport system membrane component KefB